MPSLNDRFPWLSTAGKDTLRRRFAACHEPIARRLGLAEADVAAGEELGVGNYGIVYALPALPGEVIKITTDNLEAATVQSLLEWGEAKPPGIVRYGDIWQLGKCSVLPRMRAFAYNADRGFDWHGRPRHVQPKTYYAGPGSPFRPAWVIRRESLPDAWPALKALGVKQADLRRTLFKLRIWATQRATEHGLKAPPFHTWVAPPETFNRDINAAHCASLQDALDWLLERGVRFLDFTKLANLGWRDGTGVVIRDIGFASTRYGPDEMPPIINPR